MQGNWSLVLNVLLLVGVITAIYRMIQARPKLEEPANRQPTIPFNDKADEEAIIAVRKLNLEQFNNASSETKFHPGSRPSINRQESKPKISKNAHPERSLEKKTTPSPAESLSSIKKSNLPTVMFFILAKSKRQFTGYDLLQTLLSNGMRFGDGQLFHRHQQRNGHGPVLFSLAAATTTGVFDLQNIGAFSVHGLCVFMQASGSEMIDMDRFDIMLDTAKILSEELDGYLLDDKREPLLEPSIKRYHLMLKTESPEALLQKSQEEEHVS